MTVQGLEAPTTLQRNPVHLTSAAWSQIQVMSQNALPNEGCGYLIGHDHHISRVHTTQNVHPQPRTRYQVDPVAYLDLDDELEESNEEVIGIVHSHPFTDAIPSETDRSHANPGWWYLIHGFPDHAPGGVLRAWRLDGAGPEGGDFQEHPTEVA